MRMKMKTKKKMKMKMKMRMRMQINPKKMISTSTTSKILMERKPRERRASQRTSSNLIT